MKIAALDPFAGYKTAVDDKLEDATAVLDAFQIVKLGTAVVDEIVAVSSRTPSVITVARATRSTRSRPSSAPARRTSPANGGAGWSQ